MRISRTAKIDMKIQLSEHRILPDALTVWGHAGPEVDIVMDLKNLTFRPGSITEMHAFHVLDHLFPEEGKAALANWYQMLAPGAKIHSLQDDFEYVARAFVGGDISPEIFNDLHNHPTQCTKEYLVPFFHAAGFLEADVSIWLSGAPDGVEKKHYEFILTAKRHV